MTQCELPKEELVRRKELSDNTRKMIYSLLDVAAEDETSLMTTYRDFYLQISFSELHPLMVFTWPGLWTLRKPCWQIVPTK